jgi:cyclase
VVVSEGIYAYVQPDGSWWLNNTGFLVAADGVISVDTCATERRTLAYLDAIAATAGPLPVRTVINTHHHGDHTFGNCLLPGATIVGHEGVRRGMRDWGPPGGKPYWTEVDWGAVEIAVPFVTFRDGLTVWVDDLRCELRHVGTAAHSTCDSILWVPERKVLYAGDLVFNGGTPFVVQGSVAGSIAVLEEVVAPLGAETIVPGHGPVAGPEVIEEVLGYLRFVQRLARAGREAGLSPLEIACEADLGRYAELTDEERIVGNLHRAYAELDGAAPGEPIDVAAALGDMIVYNGGRPLSCYA